MNRELSPRSGGAGLVLCVLSLSEAVPYTISVPGGSEHRGPAPSHPSYCGLMVAARERLAGVMENEWDV